VMTTTTREFYLYLNPQYLFVHVSVVRILCSRISYDVCLIDMS